MPDPAELLIRIETFERELRGSLELYRPISAVVQQEDETFVASFLDANINASGESQLDAVEELKEAIVARFLLFSSKEAVLGEEPRRQLAVLRQFIRNAVVADAPK
jgi:hypothetical protein